jgi:MFS family permease
VVELSTWRVITGLGIGGMLAALNAVAAEFSNARRRNFCVSLMAIGYPIGAVLGGLVVAQLLKVHDWRSVFLLGASVTAIFIPIVIFVLPESLHWLVRRQPPGALQKVRRTMSRLQLPPVDDLPPLAAVDKRRSPAELFTGDLRTVTILVSFAYFLHITTFYFILKWVPKIVVDMGFDASAAAGVLVWANVGGASGGALLGYLAQHHNLKHLTVGTLLLSGVMVGYFGHSAPDLAQLSYACAAAAFFCNAGIVGLYALFAQLFPTHLRASGTGFAIGFGRGGAVLSPIAAGAMLASGSDLSLVAIAMGLGSFAAACLILWLRTQRR